MCQRENRTSELPTAVNELGVTRTHTHTHTVCEQPHMTKQIWLQYGGRRGGWSKHHNIISKKGWVRAWGRCAGGGEKGFTRGKGRGLAGQRSGILCSDLMAVWFVHCSLAHVFQKHDTESRPGFKRRRAPQAANRLSKMHQSSHSSNLFSFFIWIEPCLS